MTELVGYMALFIAVAVFFVFIHLVAGRFIRPVQPDPEKLTIYECGEPTIGSSWIQFDLPFYVVALLFVIFDVEVAFFFPWAVVFGKVNKLAGMDENDSGRSAVVKELVPADLPSDLIGDGVTAPYHGEHGNDRGAPGSVDRPLVRPPALHEKEMGDGCLPFPIDHRQRREIESGMRDH